MATGFDFAIAFTLRQEGGYTADLGDGAGETHFGVTKRSYPDVDIKNLTVEQAVAIYKRDFWNSITLDSLPLPLAAAVFDGAVNSGARTAVTVLQRAVGVKEDGAIGPVTIAAARNSQRALLRFCVLRGMRYAAHPKFSTFGQVWLERLLENYLYCAGLPD